MDENLPSTIEEARATGAKYYFTGKPCKYGHMTKRLTSTRTCYKCVLKYSRQWGVKNFKYKAEHRRQWRKANRKHCLGYERQWREANPEYKAEYNRRWRKANPEYYRQWVKDNPAAAAAKRAKYRASKLKATPTWANQNRITDMYAAARLLTEQTGIAIHVDHIVPLQGKDVTGLHCEANLQLLPADANLSKGNRLID